MVFLVGYRELLNDTEELLGPPADLRSASQQLRRIEVIADDESEIIEAVRRMSDRYDFVVTRYDDSWAVRGE